MNWDTVDHPLWPHEPDPVDPEGKECPKCGSINTFITFDKKLVCRDGWHITDI